MAISKTQKRIATALAAVLTTFGAYRIAENSFNKGDSKRQYVSQQTNTFYNSLDNVEKLIIKGDLKKAMQELKTSERLAKELSKINEEYLKYLYTIERFEKVIKLAETTQEFLMESKARFDNMGVPTNKDIAWMEIFSKQLPGPIITLRDEGQKDASPEVKSAISAVVAAGIDEWRNQLEELSKKLSKTPSENTTEMNEEVKAAIAFTYSYWR